MTSVVEALVGSNGEEIHTQENAEAALHTVSMDVPSGGEVSIFRKAYYCGEYRLATPEVKVKSGKSSQPATAGSSTGPAQASQCSSYVPKSLYSGQGTVTSPNYPKSYAPNAFVNYPLVAASSNGTIKLRISDFKTEDGHDKLYIQNGLNDPHMEILSGVHNDTLVYRSTGPIMLLTFVTDNNVEMQGWYATVTTEYA
ncbi:CUB and sushi domain-containing protein 3 [Aphelenchoides avenae]|nr:CUB and sushi domain-containing protein 3 [Aphelenchus avenae]